MKGIDVSAYQGKPDWSAVRAAGIEMAIIRAANRKGKDASFEHNYTGCGLAGIKRVYTDTAMPKQWMRLLKKQWK